MNVFFKIKSNKIIEILNIMKNYFIINMVESNIFGNLWLNINNNIIKITTINLESQLTCYIKTITNNNNYYKFLIPGKKFYDICKKLSYYELLYININNYKLGIKVKNIKFQINLLKIINFPNIYKFNYKPYKIIVNKKNFKRLLVSTYFSINMKKINNYIINGLNFIIKDNILSCTAGDGYRLSTNNLVLKKKNNINISFILSKKNIIDLINLLNLNNKFINITIYLSKDYLQINFYNFYFITRIIPSYYPKLYFYKELINFNEYKIVFLIKVDLLLNSILRITSLINTKIKKITLNIRKNILILSTKNNLNELAEEYIMINYIGNNIIINVNANYIIEILNNISYNMINILIKDIFSNIIIQNYYDKNNFHLIMPYNK